MTSGRSSISKRTSPSVGFLWFRENVAFRLVPNLETGCRPAFGARHRTIFAFHAGAIVCSNNFQFSVNGQLRSMPMVVGDECEFVVFISLPLAPFKRVTHLQVEALHRFLHIVCCARPDGHDGTPYAAEYAAISCLATCYQCPWGSCPEFQAFCPFIVLAIASPVMRRNSALLKAFDLRPNAIER